MSHFGSLKLFVASCDLFSLIFTCCGILCPIVVHGGFFAYCGSFWLIMAHSYSLLFILNYYGSQWLIETHSGSILLIVIHFTLCKSLWFIRVHSDFLSHIVLYCGLFQLTVYHSGPLLLIMSQRSSLWLSMTYFASR